MKYIRHKAPENRHHKQVKNAQPDIETVLHPFASRITLEEKGKQQQVGDKKQIDARHKAATAKS